jgi:hypothetical protein
LEISLGTKIDGNLQADMPVGQNIFNFEYNIRIDIYDNEDGVTRYDLNSPIKVMFPQYITYYTFWTSIINQDTLLKQNSEMLSGDLYSIQKNTILLTSILNSLSLSEKSASQSNCLNYSI